MEGPDGHDKTALRSPEKLAGAAADAPEQPGSPNPPVAATDGAAAVSSGHAPPFLVAAVGASAGGLEAFSLLLRSIPADAPLALILVQHLARDQPSILPELLSHIAKLSVVAARDELAIEPRHVYVIPPDARMTVSDGHLRVRPGAQRREREGTVDALFRSIAAEYQERAIGVVLSGSANDGAAGIREIKTAGGFTMVQQPEQAAVDGMPRAAMATGVVDVVLPVEEIGLELTRLAADPFFARGETAEAPQPEQVTDMRRAFQLLRRATGVDFNRYKLPTLRRRIDRRIALHRLSDLHEYVSMLERDPAELALLHEELLIHVTSFFRDPASYAGLETAVFRRLVPERGEPQPIRFWVPGCSTGEEVYSLAMLTLEFLGDRAEGTPIQIFGTDISDATIDKARPGMYAADIAADVSPERLRRFFTKVAGGYRINKSIRDRCVFARHDVSRDPPFSKLDLIVCRNLLIYLNQATQQRVLDVFHYALRDDGVLMLGRSETIGAQTTRFSVTDKKCQLYSKKGHSYHGDHPHLSASRDSPETPAIKAAVPSATTRQAAWDPQTDANRFLLDNYAPPAVIVDDGHRILRLRGSTGAFLELPAGEMTADILKIVRPELAHELRTALQEARSRSRPESRSKIRFKVEGRARVIDLHVVPLGTAENRQFLVLFDEKTRGSGTAAVQSLAAAARGRDRISPGPAQHQLAEMRGQMQAVIDDLGASNEELQSANEEILSSNEELQSTNEELDTAKEELQSTNEELSTLNDELHARNDELTIVNGDLVNLLASVQIPIVIVTRDLRIRRFTPAAEKELNIIPSDVGRPIGHLKPNFVCPDLEQLITETIDTVRVLERQIEGNDGRLFAMQIRPYKSVDNRIDGAVIVMFDVSSAETQAAALQVAQATGEALMATISDPVLLLDSQIRVLQANHAFLDRFALAPSKVAGKVVFDLGAAPWSSPELRHLLQEVLPEKKNFDGFPVTYDRPHAGRRKMMLSAQRIESGRNAQGVILLVLRDVAENGSHERAGHGADDA